MPGSLADVYNFVTYISLEDGISFGIVFESSWEDLWFYVWKTRQSEAHRAGKNLIVLTKPDGSLGFNQSIKVLFFKASKIPFKVMSAHEFLRQTRPLIYAILYCEFDKTADILTSSSQGIVHLGSLNETFLDGSQPLDRFALQGANQLLQWLSN